MGSMMPEPKGHHLVLPPPLYSEWWVPTHREKHLFMSFRVSLLTPWSGPETYTITPLPPSRPGL